jgi:hypothetical protein
MMYSCTLYVKCTRTRPRNAILLIENHESEVA